MGYGSSLAPTAALFVMLSSPSAAYAQCAQERQQILASDGGYRDEFGWAIDQRGQVAAVGSWRDNAAANLSGSAYVLRRGPAGWNQEQKLVPADGQLADFFGWSVAIEGHTAAIGSVGDEDAAPDGGSVYIYGFDGTVWQEQVELFASDAAQGDHFGVSVALDGDTLLVGADLDNDHGTWSGSAYVLRRIGGTWVETQKLSPSTHQAYDHFGYSVALDGDLAVIGAYGRDSFAGAAHVFRWNGSSWIEEALLVGSQTAGGDFLGAAVAVSGGRVLCGARWADIGSKLDAGEAYLFRHDRGSWVEELRLTDAAPASGDGFGFAVDLSGDLALVGEHLRNVVGPLSGAAVLFRHDGIGWTREPRLFPADAHTNELFGMAVSVEGSSILIGAPWDDDQAEDAGSTYAFDAEGCLPCPPPVTYCTSSPNSAGAGALIDWSGSTSIAANDGFLHASDLPVPTAGIFLFGSMRDQVPFGNGVLCVGGTLKRLDPVQSDAGGRVSFHLDHSSLPPGTIVPGDTRYFQLWYRDVPAGGAGFNTSDALEVFFCQ